MSDLKPPCDCIEKLGGCWCVVDCQCGNKGDYGDARAWCAEHNRPAAVPVEALRVQIDEWRAQEAIDPNEIDYCTDLHKQLTDATKALELATDADLNALIDHEIEYAERRELVRFVEKADE